MQVKSYESAVKYLEGFIGKIVFKVDKEYLKHHDPLERMRVLLSLLGNPQDKFKSVLVGGTSGKGSTAYLISHILTTAGYKTGLTISPHLQRINERIQRNGKPISDQKFTDLLNSILSSIEGMKEMKIGEPSYFEILIAMAFLYFAKEKMDIAVVEVGMGGEYDATNTLYPLIAVLTNVSLDHTNVLGKTVQEIGKTKAGIIKKSQKFNKELIVVSGVTQPPVIRIVENRCKEVGAKLYRLGRDFDFKIEKETFEGSVFGTINLGDRLKKLSKLKLSLLGEHQVENSSLAIEAVRQLADFGFKVSDENIRKALKTAFFPGRFEVIKCHLHEPEALRAEWPEFISGSPARRQVFSRSNEMLNSSKRTFLVGGGAVQHDKETTLILDGAHNPTKMKTFLTSLEKLFPKQKKFFVVGFKFDKDIPKMLQQITKVADAIIVTEFDRATDMAISSSADAESIKYEVLSIKYKGQVLVEKNSKKALDKALNYPITQLPYYQTIVVVTGSLYLVGEIRNML